ncbi:hypothetical protein [Bosea sp. ANAM02]|uniref:hypothetical protein n=1 Tax=Bosea sp. ANAM02 TaxID=2020412 RepID=UPI001565AAD3|nr:hypothetical protein [Bosea sp. ANAM02]
MHVLSFLAQRQGTWTIPTGIPDLKGNLGKVSGVALNELRLAGLIEYGKEPQHSLHGYRLTALGIETELASRHRIEKYDRVSRRIVDEAGQVVALALLLGNDQWCLADTEGKRIGRTAYAAPKDALSAFVTQRIEIAMKAREEEPDTWQSAVRKA